LHEALEGIQVWKSPDTMVGIETFDDAGIHRLSPDTALVQTLDFFTPIVDDPYDFGQIAMANALSDVYAKGGRPITAMNILCYPNKELSAGDLRRILQGGADKLREAGVSLLGGHSVTDSELKFGASITGVVRPGEEWRNAGALEGDRLVLAKPIGTGIVTTAHKFGKAPPELLRTAVESMKKLNAAAADGARRVGGIHACTDITGYGLAGHAAQMAKASGVRFRISMGKVPLLPGAREYARRGCKTRGDWLNREHLEGGYRFADGTPKDLQDLAFDPQTSGGLFFSVEANRAESLVGALREAGYPEAAVAGDVLAAAEPILLEFAT
jgi:selenide,water dikinase